MIHVYLLGWKMLLLVPAASPRACAPPPLRYGPKDGSWESGFNPPAQDCAFRVAVMPGDLLPAWAELPPKQAAELDVTYGDKTGSTAPQKLEPQLPAAGSLSARAEKAGNRVRVEVTNKGDKPVLLGDSVALRGKPKDDCVGPGPAAVLQPGERLVDLRPGLLSPSMKVWVSAFTGEKQCRWIEVARQP